MDGGILELAASVGGIGGLMAVLCIYIYRRDRKETLGQMRQDRIFMEDRLSKVIESYNSTVTANTTITTELVVWLKSRNGHRDS